MNWLLVLGRWMELSPIKSKLISKRLVFANGMSVVTGPSKVEFWKRSSCQLMLMKSSVSIKLGSKVFCSFSFKGG